MQERDGFAEALLAAPVGVALLGLLEGEVRDDLSWWEMPRGSKRDAVVAAADAVRNRSLGSLLAKAVYAAYWQVGPWMPSAAAAAEAAYRHAEERLLIAEAIEERFGEDLHEPLDVDAQEWWHSDTPAEGTFAEPLFRSFDSVYGAGQFSWAGLWTVTRPPPATHDDLVCAWEIDPEPVSRWRLPVLPGARIVEIHRPADWTALVVSYPVQASVGQEGWELPGRQHEPGGLAALTSLPGQRAARTSIRRHLVPDWGQVAADHDGIHLSWAGFLTSEGCVSDLDGGDVAMLRYWFSERTHWLTDTFGDPEPLEAPNLDNEGTNRSADVRADTRRRCRDEAVLNAQLGR